VDADAKLGPGHVALVPVHVTEGLHTVPLPAHTTVFSATTSTGQS
jgi:hypothetical protein